MHLIESVKGRRLLQIVGSVAAGGWLALQVIDQLANRGILPHVFYYVFLVWYLVGMVAAGIIGWYHGERGRQSISRTEASLLVGLAVAGLSGTAIAVSGGEPADPEGSVSSMGPRLDPTRILVEYLLDESSDGSLGYLADGLTETLIYELSSVPTLDVLSQNASATFRTAHADTIGRTVQAGTVVSGALRGDGPGVRMYVALRDGYTGEELNRRSFTHPTRDPVELRESVSNQVGLFLRDALGQQVDLRPAPGESQSAEAWEAVLRAAAAHKQLEAAVSEGDGQAIMAAWGVADSLSAEAEAIDPSWARPPADRANLAMRLAQLSVGEPGEVGEWVAQGMEHVERALALDPTWAAALETRGGLRYLLWEFGLERDPVAAPALLLGAEADLEEAVRIDGTRAVAYNLLSIIHSQKPRPDPAAAKVAARRAYEEDAYVRASEALLGRLYSTSYDLQQFSDAQYYCELGKRRFPGDYRFHECELWLLTTPQMEPDVERAWALVDQLVDRAPGNRAFLASRAHILIGGVIARAQLPDSARRVFERARVSPETDPRGELLGLEAAFRLQLDDEQEAVKLLTTYLTAHPEHREGWGETSHWWWAKLRDNPEFQSLIGS